MDTEGASVNYLSEQKPEINQKRRGNMLSRELTSHIHTYFDHGNLSHEVEKSISWTAWIPADGTVLPWWQSCFLRTGGMFMLQQDHLCNLFFILDTRQQ